MNANLRKMELIVEKNDDHFWGRVEGKGFMPTGQGETIEDLIHNVKESIEDYVEHEGKNDSIWSKVTISNLVFDIRYDLEAFFKEHDYLNITSIAKRAGMNPGLLRQYASGVKNPSAEQVKKIEDAVHSIAENLSKVSIRPQTNQGVLFTEKLASANKMLSENPLPKDFV